MYHISWDTLHFPVGIIPLGNSQKSAEQSNLIETD